MRISLQPTKLTETACLVLVLAVMQLGAAPLSADDTLPPAATTTPDSPQENTESQLAKAEPLSNEALAAKARPSLVFIRSTDRTGGDLGLGAGFVIDPSGLIATARHVIGDGRDFVVELPGGKTVPVTEIHASSNQLDLAIIRVDANDLVALPVSEEDEVAQGRDVVAMGHPRGLRNSMASGLVSGHQDIDGIRMVQLAMSIEPGNSGGPVVDRQGNVVGIVTMKSTVVKDVGFALPVKLLRDLLSNPNPVPMSRWRTIGALDSRQWRTVFGGNWRQRAGRITVNGQGTSFGGRTLCLKNRELPDVPFDLQVIVRLKDEQGAAGLVFHSDGQDRHYGFYPSAGNLRLTRFDGADVNSWTILHNEPHESYKPGDWNTLTVRIHSDRFECYVNGALAVESRDTALTEGQAGIAAFRGTEAEFRRFDAGQSLLPSSLDAQAQEQLSQAVKDIEPGVPADDRTVAGLLPLGESAAEILNSEAKLLEQRGKQLRQLSQDLHDTATRQKIAQALLIPPQNPEANGTQPVSDQSSPNATPAAGVTATSDAAAEHDEKKPDLLRAALLLAHMDNPDVDVEAYVARIRDMADELKATFPENATEAQRLAALDKYLFEDLGVRGSQFEYYARSNSYLNEVIDDREGLPITLAVLYMELAARVDLTVVGVGLPGHFVVRYEASDEAGADELIDPFERGRRLTEQDVLKKLSIAGFPNEPRFREAKSPVQIIERMTLNLLGLMEDERSDGDVLRYLETLVMLEPTNPEHRAKRLEMRARTGRLEMAIRDADWFIKNELPSVDVERVRELRQSLELQLERQKAAPTGIPRSE